MRAGATEVCTRLHADAKAEASPLAAASGQDGNLGLSDGRRLVPAGVVLPTRLHPDADLVARAAEAANGVLEGRFIRLGTTARDRHGRLVGSAELAAAEAGAPAVPLALALLEAGAGYADPRAAPACANALLAAEAEARRHRRGLFAAEGAIVAAGDEVAVGVHAGLFTLVQGRVRAAGATREKAYLNFGGRWREDFTVIVAAKDFATILGEDLNPDMLRGALVEVRGVVREEGGPAIFVRTAQDMAVLDGPAGAGARKGADW